MSLVHTMLPRLPSATAILLLTSILAPANAHVLPRQTLTIDYRQLDVLPYPPLPTAASLLPYDLLRRQEENTICGYVGGDPALPATCSAGSHCVVDQGVGAIGCCPNGGGACTTGVFTGCVDANSGPQTELNPYVFTCVGSDVCYRNTFEGGNFQYGCGSASDMAATVVATASGVTALPALETVSAPLTATPSQLSEPTTLGSVSSGSQTTSTASSTDTSSSSSASSSASSSTSTDDSSSTSAAAESSTASGEPVTEAPDASSSGGVNKTGAIIGGSISGAAVLIGLLVVGLFCWKRKRGNKRQGPGPKENIRYISPMTGASGFAPIGSGRDTYEQAYMPGQNGNQTTIISNKGMAQPAHHPTAELDQPFGYGPSGEVVPMRATHNAQGGSGNDDQVPLTQEYDEFSRGFNEALTRIDEEDSRPATAVNNSSMSGSGNAFTPSAEDEADLSPTRRYVRGNGGGPLWQQNRQQSSRNMMWM
ncbi:hypothetical protein VdG2_04572 [Verticillium dahliae VDG2]|nr:hypothetical protein VdG2_04572 [Verticillium dahliae VDG2]